MKITICGSIAFHDEMKEAANFLKNNGHEVDLPPSYIKDKSGNPLSVKDYYMIRKNEEADTGWVWDRKKEAMKVHFDKIVWSDAVLIINHEKNNIPGYIGANTLMEMGLALHLNKAIYLLNEIPEINYKEEILGMKPILINGNINLIK